MPGYNGNRNTGSDVRVEEMLRQVRQVLGAKNVELTVTALDFKLTRGYFGDAAQVLLPDMFPPFLYKEVRKHHGVIACEGSMFKSKFANALTTMFIGALGMAAVENKLSIGYGAEAGYMDRVAGATVRALLPQFGGGHAQFGIAGRAQRVGRGERTGHGYGLDLRGRTRRRYGRKALSDAGWDGSAPVLIFCPINPFFWPVKASTLKWAAHGGRGSVQGEPLSGPYFHKAGTEVDAQL